MSSLSTLLKFSTLASITFSYEDEYNDEKESNSNDANIASDFAIFEKAETLDDFSDFDDDDILYGDFDSQDNLEDGETGVSHFEENDSEEDF